MSLVPHETQIYIKKKTMSVVCATFVLFRAHSCCYCFLDIRHSYVVYVDVHQQTFLNGGCAWTLQSIKTE